MGGMRAGFRGDGGQYTPFFRAFDGQGSEKAIYHTEIFSAALQPLGLVLPRFCNPGSAPGLTVMILTPPTTLTSVSVPAGFPPPT